MLIDPNALTAQHAASVAEYLDEHYTLTDWLNDHCVKCDVCERWFDDPKADFVDTADYARDLSWLCHDCAEDEQTAESGWREHHALRAWAEGRQ
jgi:hypothetical protein